VQYIDLFFTDELHQHLLKYPQFIQVILGPRQVGKTTTILKYLEKNHRKKHHFYSAEKLLGGGLAWLTDVWLKARKEKKLLVIDEIQKIENWAEIIKKFWDEEKRSKHPIQCVLLGSSSLDLHVGLTESLTGRFQLIQAYQWNYAESKKGYGLDFNEYLKFGGYPGSYDLRDDLQKWQSYVRHSIVETVVEKDILMSHKVKSPALFKQAFDLLISYPAQEISFTKLLGQLQDKGNTELIKYYIRLYEGAFLIKTLEKFSTNKIKKRTSAPKIIPLCPAFSFIGELEEYNSETRGHVFEAVVGCTLNRLGFELYYWRDGNHEVDYVLKFGKKIWAIEVKSGRKRKMGGLDQFLKNFPKSIPILITPENYIEFENDPQGFLSV
jgi:predicted AAA+ superfamily ATPase